MEKLRCGDATTKEEEEAGAKEVQGISDERQVKCAQVTAEIWQHKLIIFIENWEGVKKQQNTSCHQLTMPLHNSCACPLQSVNLRFS